MKKIAKKEPVLEQQLATLTQHLNQIDGKLKKQLSFKRSLLMSILNGVGYAIGAGMVAALLIAILNWTISSISDLSILSKIILTQD